jgi:nucleotide-binding universal stress UspA family protein
MFEQVIVGVDGRQGGRDAIELASQLAGPGATLTLANVFERMWVPAHGLTRASPGEDQEAAERMLAEHAPDSGISVELVVVASTSPARGLHELAEASHADLLVLGSCHRGAFGRATLGDDTRAGLNGAPCAVAVAPHGYAAVARPFASIGVAFNGTSESEEALAAARELAPRTGARIRALNVVTPPRYLFTGMLPPVGMGIDELVKAAESEMDCLDGVDAEARYGAIDPDLEEFSKEVDLLIAGSRAYGPAMRLIEGSTSRYLLRHSRAPLLVLPRGARSSRTGTHGARASARQQVPA